MGSHSQTPVAQDANWSGSFTGVPIRKSFNGFLFDMDGTIIDSTEAIVKHWHLIGEELGFDPEMVLATSHGRRSIDTLQVLDPSKANWDYVHKIEARIPAEYGQDAKEIPGARATLDKLIEISAPWAIVTSGTRPLVQGWLNNMALPLPPNTVTAEDVSNGKPDPACYNLGRKRIGLNDGVSSILVFEDAPSGIRAGKAAGCTVLGLATTHSVESVLEAGADIVIKDLRSFTVISVNNDAGGRMTLEVEFSNPWKSPA